MLITHFGVDSSTIFVQQTLGSIHQEVGLKSKSILKTDLVFIFVNFFLEVPVIYYRQTVIIFHVRSGEYNFPPGEIKIVTDSILKATLIKWVHMSRGQSVQVFTLPRQDIFSKKQIVKILFYKVYTSFHNLSHSFWKISK